MATVTKASAVTMPGIELVTKLAPSTNRARNPLYRTAQPGEREGQDGRDQCRPPPPARWSGRAMARCRRTPRPARRRSTASGPPSTQAPRGRGRRMRRGRRRRESHWRPGDVAPMCVAPPQPILAYRALPRAAASATSSTRHSSTSTPASVLPAAPLKVAWNCSKIAVVRVAKRSIANAPYSASRCTPISRPPPRIASRSCGSTTRQKTPAEPEPSARADSSIAGSSRRSVAARARRRTGSTTASRSARPRRSRAATGTTPTQRVAVDEGGHRQGRDEQRPPERRGRGSRCAPPAMRRRRRARRRSAP